MRYTKAQIIEIREEMTEALNRVARKYSSSVKIGRISFGENMSAKIEMNRIASNEHGEFVMTPEAKEFLNRTISMGIRKDVLNEPFIYQGKNMKITGYKTRGKKYPITYMQNDKPYKCSVDHMLDMIRENRPELFL